jgi:hypothetical protein
MSIPTVYFCDDSRGNELAVGEYLARGHKTTFVPLKRSDNWKLPADAEKLCAGQTVLYVGSYSPANVEQVTKWAAHCTTFVYSEADAKKVTGAVTDASLFTYVRKVAPVEAKEHERLLAVTELLDVHQTRKLSLEETQLMHGIKTGKQPTLHAEIKAALDANVTLAQLREQGKTKWEFIQFVVSHWFRQSFEGKWNGVAVRVCHANPFLIEAGDYCAESDKKAELIVLYHVEKTTLRFTLLSPDPKKVSAVSLASKHGGGGDARQAGFGVSLTEGGALLESMK